MFRRFMVKWSVFSVAVMMVTQAVAPSSARAAIVRWSVGQDLSVKDSILATFGARSGGVGAKIANFFLGGFGCLLLLPLCLLNETAPGSNSTSVANLKANGFSDADIATIMSDQQKLVSALATKGMELKIGPNDTAESIGKEIREAAPGVSDVYVNYFTGSVGL